MLRQVTIEEYWPLIVKNTAEFQQIAVAENPEFNKLAECIYRVLKDGFIADATEYGVERWEKIIGISPDPGATLDERKATILYYLSVKLPYTWRVLKQMLTDYIGDAFVLEYVNDEGKLVLHTDRIADDKLQTIQDLLERVLPQNIEVVQYNHNMEVSWRDKLYKYAACVNLADMRAVNPEYKKDLTSDGEWLYALTSLEVCNEGDAWGLFASSPIKKINLEFPSLKSTKSLLRNAFGLETAKLNLPVCTNMHSPLLGNPLVHSAEVIAPVATTAFYAFGHRYNPCPKLSHVRLYAPMLSNAYWAFESCILDRDSVQNIVSTIPAYTSGLHPLDLGIHIDHQTDEDVLAAIAEAEAKGWTLTVKWNGTPTSGVSTLDLEEIYAKVTESEYGEYTDENGTRCTLDWGHYVTDTTDYKLFFSLVEAEQYFKLTRVENNE